MLLKVSFIICIIDCNACACDFNVMRSLYICFRFTKHAVSLLTSFAKNLTHELKIQIFEINDVQSYKIAIAWQASN
jgi:hypothetical protein